MMQGVKRPLERDLCPISLPTDHLAPFSSVVPCLDCTVPLRRLGRAAGLQSISKPDDSQHTVTMRQDLEALSA